MEKKEFYKHNLPHFQQPGQAYFFTWSLKDAVPKKALIRYTRKLELLKSQIAGATVSELLNIKKRGSESAPPGCSESGAAVSESPDFKKRI